MKVLRKLMFSVTIFSALIAPTVTYALTAGELKEWGDANDRIQRHVGSLPEDEMPSLAFLSYVTAVVDHAVSSLLVCFPATYSGGQLSAVTYNYLRQHPEKWSDRANLVVLLAFQEAFPCPDSNP